LKIFRTACSFWEEVARVAVAISVLKLAYLGIFYALDIQRRPCCSLLFCALLQGPEVPGLCFVIVSKVGGDEGAGRDTVGGES